MLSTFKQTLMRKRTAVATLIVAAVAALAIAYWTADGTGTGTGTVGTDDGVTIDPVTVTDTLYPGGSSNVDFTVNNDSSNTSVRVDKVVEDSITIDAGHSGCQASDFSFADVAFNKTIAAGGSEDGSGSLDMANTAANQDACKGATVTLNLKTDNSGI